MSAEAVEEIRGKIKELVKRIFPRINEAESDMFCRKVFSDIFSSDPRGISEWHSMVYDSLSAVRNNESIEIVPIGRSMIGWSERHIESIEKRIAEAAQKKPPEAVISEDMFELKCLIFINSPEVYNFLERILKHYEVTPPLCDFLSKCINLFREFEKGSTERESKALAWQRAYTDLQYKIWANQLEAALQNKKRPEPVAGLRHIVIDIGPPLSALPEETKRIPVAASHFPVPSSATQRFLGATSSIHQPSYRRCPMSEEKKSVATTILEPKQAVIQDLFHLLKAISFRTLAIQKQYLAKKRPQQANQSRSNTSINVASATGRDGDIKEQKDPTWPLKKIYDHWNSTNNGEGLKNLESLMMLRDAAFSLGKALFERAKLKKSEDRFVEFQEALLYLQEAFNLQKIIVDIDPVKSPEAEENLKHYKSLLDQCDEAIKNWYPKIINIGLIQYDKGRHLIEQTSQQLKATERTKALLCFMKAFEYFEKRRGEENDNNMNLACLQASAFMVGRVLVRNPAMDNLLNELKEVRIWFEKAIEIEQGAMKIDEKKAAAIKKIFLELIGISTEKPEDFNLTAECNNQIAQLEKRILPPSFEPGFFGATSSPNSESKVASSTQSLSVATPSVGAATVSQNILPGGQSATAAENRQGR